MVRQAGIPLVDLFNLLDRTVTALPQDLEDFFEQFVAVGLRPRPAVGATFHTGTLQPVDASITEIPQAFDLGIGKLSLPLLQTGIPFELGMTRAAIAGNLEPGPLSWRLDLSLDAFRLELDSLEPAIYVPDTATVPRHLLRDPTREKVVIKGRAVLRIQVASPGATPAIALIDRSDPLNPVAPSGATASITCSPPHFFIGGSEFGLSVGRLTFDMSQTFSPPEVTALGEGPPWTGLMIAEATFYAPRNLPGLGDLSGGVRNVLIGIPAGLQGELEIQFGRTPMAPEAVRFAQVTASGETLLAVDGAGSDRTVTMTGRQSDTVTIAAGLPVSGPPPDPDLPQGALQDWTMRWTWPDGRSETSDASTGSIRHGQVLRATPVEIVTVDGEATEFPHPEISYRFLAGGTGPRIDTEIGGAAFANAVHVAGTADGLSSLLLRAEGGGTGSFVWTVEGESLRREGATFQPPLTGSGSRTVVLTEEVGPDDVRLTRLMLEIRGEGAALVGCEGGVFDVASPSAPLALAAVEATFDLSDFHASGALNATRAQAVLDASQSSGVSVPADGLAEVTLSAGAAPVARDRHVQILMDFDTDSELSWGTLRPAGVPGSGAFSQSDLLAWAARYPGAELLVVGRCDDIGDAGYNGILAADRAARAEALLSEPAAGTPGAGLDPANIFIRGEQSGFGAGDAGGDTAEEDAEIGLSPAEKSEAVGDAGLAGGWLIRFEHPEFADWPVNRDVTGPSEPIRSFYRRADLYAVGGTPTAESVLPGDAGRLDSSLRRSFVPAAGRAPVPRPAGSPAIDYRVKLRIVWDSPTVSKLKDAIPTLAEAEFAWTPQAMPLPPVDGDEVDLSVEVLTVFVTWTHDARTGYTKATLGIRSDGDPDGLISSEAKPLIAALGFGPALLSGVDGDDDVIAQGARVAALLALVGASGTNLGGSSTFIGGGSKVSLISAALETEMRSISDPGADTQYRVMTEYVCAMHIDAGVLGIRTLEDAPLKIRYKDVGIEYDTSQSDWNRFGFVFDTTSLEIEDPGRWRVEGELGELLRIVEVAIGQGSVWFEARLATAIEIGLIEITEAIVRLTFSDRSPVPAFELRGLVVKATVPGVLEGEGRIRIEDPGGILRAGLEASIIPLGIGAEAALALAKPPDIAPSVFASLYVGVQFATPLPLANSGLALYGLKGLFTMNGTRDVGTSPDVVGRELAWWAKAPELKYRPEAGQYALGVGAVVGTLPDLSFSLSCAGMVVVAFPDPEVLFGVDVGIIKVPDTLASDSRGSESTITGLIVIDDQAVKLGVSATYAVPGVIEIEVPFAGYFPYPGTGKEVYVRIGSDGETEHGRFGEPVTVTVLPGVLDARAWAYLMIEQGGLPALGGDDEFSFDGFSVGFGAGWEIDWKAGPIELHAGSKVLVGFGTAPLIIRGGVFVEGKLDLQVVSISAIGSLVLEAREIETGGDQDVAVKIEGEFCGEVSLAFFKLKGCVGVTIDSNPDLEPPPPPSPVASVVLADRRDRLMGVATKGETVAGNPVVTPEPDGAGVEANNVVWPDTAPVIQFRHYVRNAMPSFAQFVPGPTPTQPEWSGSSELKYAYRLDSIVLTDAATGSLVASLDPTGTLQSTWTTSPYRQPFADGEGNPLPSEHEGPALKLLDWNPWTWAVNLNDGGASQPGDPAETIEDLCEPSPIPTPACVLGASARRSGEHGVRMFQTRPAAGPYPSRFRLTGASGIGETTGAALTALVTAQGGHVLPGAVVGLSLPAEVGGRQVRRGYRLPLRRDAGPDDLFETALTWTATFDREVAAASILLEVCKAGASPPGDMLCDTFTGLAAEGIRSEVVRRHFRVVPVRGPLVLSDDVDLRGRVPVRGSDGQGDIRISVLGGIEVRFDDRTDRVLAHVMLGNPTAVTAVAYDAAGHEVAEATSGTEMEVPHVLELVASDIVAVRLKDGAGEGALFQICHRRLVAEQRDCIDFRGLKVLPDPVRTLEHGGHRFESISRAADITVLDIVSRSGGHARPGRDGAAELQFAATGLRITLPKERDAVEIKLMLFQDAPVAAVARDSRGRQVAKATTGTRREVELALTLRGAGIRTVELAGGAGEAVLYEICRVRPAPEESDADDVRVRGRLGDEAPVRWPGTVLAEDGDCRLVLFEPRRASDGWDGLRIETERNHAVTVVSVCGIDRSAADARANDEAVKEQWRDSLGDLVAVGPEERREIVLFPGHDYELAIGWSWRAWQASAPGQSPPPADSGTWTQGDTDTYRFRTAAEVTDAAWTQDGLNEYVFDPRDVDRYVVAVEPADGHEVHFTDDPVLVHFQTGHVEQLLELYGRALRIDIRRTDSPPTAPPSGSPSALAVGLQWLDPSRDRIPAAQQRLNDAVFAAPCFGQAAPFGGGILAATAELEPRAAYDLSLVADGEDGARVLRATRFRTSRYANPRAFLDALGYRAETAPYLPDDIIAPEGALLPTGGLIEGDAMLEAALEAAGVEALAPPQRPRSHAIWRLDGGAWLLLGLLVDAPEPLRRQRTIVDGAGQPQFGDRMTISHAMIGADRLDLVRLNAAATRALLTPASPIDFPSDGDHELDLHFTTSGGLLTGARRIRSVPSILEREGL